MSLTLGRSFKVGDTVQLKSGGPVMTVDFLQTTAEGANCKWFDGNNQLQSGQFALAALQIDDFSERKSRGDWGRFS